MGLLVIVIAAHTIWAIVATVSERGGCWHAYLLIDGLLNRTQGIQGVDRVGQLTEWTTTTASVVIGAAH